MTEDGLNISTGLGEGMAQVLNPYHNKYLDDLIGQKKTRILEGNKREQEALGKLSSLNKLDIFFRDQPKFQQMQKDLRDSTMKNIYKIREGDPTAIGELQQQIADIENEANLSKNTREQYENLAKEVLMKKNEYRPQTHDYLEKFASNENIGNYNFDYSNIKKNLDLYQDFRQNLLPTFEQAKEKGQIAIPQSDGSVKTIKTEEFTDKDAVNLAKTYLSDPVRLEQANYDFSQLPPEKQEQYGGDILNWYKDSYLKPYIQKETFTSRTEPESKSSQEKKNVNVTYDIGKDGKEIVTFSKQEGIENKPLDFIVNGEVVRGIPSRIEQPKGKTPRLYVSVETGRVNSDGVSTPIYEEKMIPYDVASRAIQKEYGFNYFGIKNEKTPLPKHINLTRNKPTNDNIVSKTSLPKKGDIIKTKEGEAIFDGTKWKLK